LWSVCGLGRWPSPLRGGVDLDADELDESSFIRSPQAAKARTSRPVPMTIRASAKASTVSGKLSKPAANCSTMGRYFDDEEVSRRGLAVTTSIGAELTIGLRRTPCWPGRSAESRGWRQDDATLLEQGPPSLAGSAEELRRNL
jgi:hypothetical protein